MNLVANFFHWLVEWLPYLLVGVPLIALYLIIIHEIYHNLTKRKSS